MLYQTIGSTYIYIYIACFKVHPKVQFCLFCNEPLWLEPWQRKKIWNFQTLCLIESLESQNRIVKELLFCPPIRSFYFEQRLWDTVWCCWEHLREHLGNLRKKLKMHWEHGRNIRIQKFQACLLHYPLPWVGVPIYVFYYRNWSNLTYIAPKSKVKTIVGQVSSFEENSEFLFLTKFRRTDPILEKQLFSNLHTHSNFSKWNKPSVFKKTHFQLAWSISTKEKGGKPNKIPSLEEPSLALTTRLEMEAVCTLYNAINTLYL